MKNCNLLNLRPELSSQIAPTAVNRKNDGNTVTF